VSNPAYSSSNILASSTASASGEVTGFAASYTVDNRPGRQSWNTYDTGVCSWTWDCGSSQTATCFAIINHNFTDDSQWKLESGASLGSLTTRSTFSPTFSTGALRSYWESFSSQSHRYWKLTTVSAAASPDPAKLGAVWIGGLVTLSKGWTWGATQGEDRVVRGLVTEGGFRHTLLRSRRRTWGGSFADGVTPTVRNEIETMYNAVNGSASAFLFIPDQSDAENVAIARFDDESWRAIARAKHSTNNAYWGGLTLDVSEEPYGS
jgi:hypothetical protein